MSICPNSCWTFKNLEQTTKNIHRILWNLPSSSSFPFDRLLFCSGQLEWLWLWLWFVCLFVESSLKVKGRFPCLLSWSMGPRVYGALFMSRYGPSGCSWGFITFIIITFYFCCSVEGNAWWFRVWACVCVWFGTTRLHTLLVKDHQTRMAKWTWLHYFWDFQHELLAGDFNQYKTQVNIN